MVARKGNKKDAAKPVVKKAADPLYPARPRNFRIGGDIRVKNKDLGRYVKWPRNVRIQRQRKILWQRLSVPPAINQFYSAVNKNQATSLFKLLMKYRPATDAEKTARRTAAAEKAKSGDVTPAKAPLAIKFGLKHVTSLIEEKRAKLVCIASDVEPIELVVWLRHFAKRWGFLTASLRTRLVSAPSSTRKPQLPYASQASTKTMRPHCVILRKASLNPLTTQNASGRNLRWD